MSFNLKRIFSSIHKTSFCPSRDWNKLYKAASNKSYEEALKEYAKFYGTPEELFDTHSPGTNGIKGDLDSLYMGTSGNVYLLDPHTHDNIAGRVIRAVEPNVQAPKIKTKGGGFTHGDLTERSGIMRFQIYNNGMGVTVDLKNPPTLSQLNAIHKIFKMTKQEVFVAEITFGKKVIENLDSFPKLVAYVNEFKSQRLDKIASS